MTRLLHTMLRVSDLDKAIEFYTSVLGMKLVRYKEFPEASFSLAFLGYGMSCLYNNKNIFLLFFTFFIFYFFDFLNFFNI